MPASVNMENQLGKLLYKSCRQRGRQREVWTKEHQQQPVLCGVAVTRAWSGEGPGLGLSWLQEWLLPRVLPPHLPRLKLGTSGACHGALCASLGLFCPSHPGPSRLGQTGVANAYDRTCKHGHAVAARWIAPPHTPILCQAGLLAALLACWGQGPLSHVGILHTLGDNDSLGRDLSWKQQWMLTGHGVEVPTVFLPSSHTKASVLPLCGQPP